MAKIEPRVLKGFRDYLPRTMIPRQKMLAKIESTFQRFGFAPLMTPALEYLDVLTGKYGEEGDSLLYQFQDNGQRDVALRYDLTVPLARVMAQYGDLNLPFRRYQIAPVWRAEKPARGRFREFIQCDGDIVGSPDMTADGEIVGLAASLLEGLGVSSYRIEINNRKVLSGVMEAIGVEAGDREMGVLRTIDKLPKIGREKTAALLESENGLGEAEIDSVFRFLSLSESGDAKAILAELSGMFHDDTIGEQGVRELRDLFAVVDALGLSGSVSIDLSIARGLNYYTGTIYETFLRDLDGYGAVMGGGRYDGLIGMFRGDDIPAVGISLGIDRLLEGLVELGVLEAGAAVAPVLVTVFDAERRPHCARLAQILRGSGIACELYPQVAKMKKQLKHAERSGFRYVVVAGPSEVEAGNVAIKDLSTGEQVTVAEGDMAGHLAKALG